jgi:hypothetical protein
VLPSSPSAGVPHTGTAAPGLTRMPVAHLASARPHIRAIHPLRRARRPPDEADAQALRAAVLLDELPAPAGAPAGAVVVEAKASGALRLMQATCSRRVLVVPTNALAAFRCACPDPGPAMTLLPRTQGQA